MKASVRRAGFLLGTSLVATLLVGACADEPVAPEDVDSGPNYSLYHIKGHEEELFGNIIGTNGSGYTVELVDVLENQVSYFDGSMQATETHDNYEAHYGWYAVETGDGECYADRDDNVLERHAPDIGDFKEVHCVGPGQFLFRVFDEEGLALVRPIDYENATFVQPAAVPGGPGIGVYIGNGFGTSGVGIHDLRLDYDPSGTGTQPNLSPKLSAYAFNTIQTITPVGNLYEYPSNFSVLFGGVGGTSGGLTRWFWNWPNQTPSTGFFGYNGPGHVVQQLRTGSATSYTVGYQHVEPWQWPADPNDYDETSYGSVGSFVVDGYASLTVNITAPSSNLFTGVSLPFSSTGGNGDGSPSYSWTFEDGSPSTSTAASPNVQFASDGSKTVTLKKTDGNGFWVVTTTEVVITAPLVADSILPSVDGGLPVRSNLTCEYEAVTSGGTGTLTYVWRKKTGRFWTTLGETSAWLQTSSGTSSFDLRFIVTDGAAQDSTDLHVTVSSTGNYCM